MIGVLTMTMIIQKKVSQILEQDRLLIPKRTYDLLQVFSTSEEDPYEAVVKYIYGNPLREVNISPFKTSSFYDDRESISEVNLTKNEYKNIALSEIVGENLSPDLMDIFFDIAPFSYLMTDLVVYSGMSDSEGAVSSDVTLDTLPKTISTMYTYLNELAIRYLNGEISVGVIANKYINLFSYLGVTSMAHSVKLPLDTRIDYLMSTDTIPNLVKFDKFDPRIIQMYVEMIDDSGTEVMMSRFINTVYDLFFRAVYVMKMGDEEDVNKVEELNDMIVINMYDTQMMIKGLTTIENFNDSSIMREYKNTRNIKEDSIIEVNRINFECITSSLLCRNEGPMSIIFDHISSTWSNEYDSDTLLSLLDGVPKLAYIFYSVGQTVDNVLKPKITEDDFFNNENNIIGEVSKFMESQKEGDTIIENLYIEHLTLDEYTIVEFAQSISSISDVSEETGPILDCLLKKDYKGIPEHLRKIKEEDSTTPLVPSLAYYITIFIWTRFVSELVQKNLPKTE